MFINLLAMALILLIGVLILASFQPNDYRIERSANISAEPEAIFARVNDFHQWEPWSPWAKLDPAAKNTFDGSPSGKGGIFMWSGNNKVGEGKMTLTESRPGELIRIHLEFVRPFKDTSTTEFTFKPQGNQTVVTWAMFGERKYLNKVVCMFMNMDKMVGGDFARGLSQLKAVVEAKAV